jgi:hypothetical protein
MWNSDYNKSIMLILDKLNSNFCVAFKEFNMIFLIIIMLLFGIFLIMILK